MIYYVDELSLIVVQEISINDTNDVFICKDVNSPISMIYTLVCIKDKEVSKKMLSMFFNTNKKPYKKCFTKNECLCYVFDYERERNFEIFFNKENQDIRTIEDISLNLVTEILSLDMPYPLLYLLLNRSLINIRNDNEIYFSYYFDLSLINFKENEVDCVRECALILLNILEKKKTPKCYQIVNKKFEKGIYKSFIELYRDIRMSRTNGKKQSFLFKIKDFFINNKDRIFNGLLVFCIITSVVSTIRFLTGVSNIELFKVFSRDFNTIGTEVLDEN